MSIPLVGGQLMFTPARSGMLPGILSTFCRRNTALVLKDTPRGRYYSTVGRQLVYEEYGEPQQVVQERELTLDRPGQGQVLVKMLAAPVNPADINTVQGTYAVRPPLPSVPGNEGVGQVVGLGEEGGGSQLQVGDWVIPRTNAVGTWCTHLLLPQAQLIKVPSDAELVMAATIAVNPGTAYRMLHDYVSLQSGDTVIQNGANSAVGQAVIQIASALGFNTINVVRDRPNIEELKEQLTSLGATLVLTEAELRKSKAVRELPTPRLGLNCVSGRSGAELVRQLAPGGFMVTYGGMSRQPVTAGVGALIFNDVSLRGFWMTRWNQEHHHHPQRDHMLSHLFQLARSGLLQPPAHTLVPFSDFQTALRDAMPTEGKLGKKQILVFD